MTGAYTTLAKGSLVHRVQKLNFPDSLNRQIKTPLLVMSPKSAVADLGGTKIQHFSIGCTSGVSFSVISWDKDTKIDEIPAFGAQKKEDEAAKFIWHCPALLCYCNSLFSVILWPVSTREADIWLAQVDGRVIICFIHYPHPVVHHIVDAVAKVAEYNLFYYKTSAIPRRKHYGQNYSEFLVLPHSNR